jgi:hypothetical protein
MTSVLSTPIGGVRTGKPCKNNQQSLKACLPQEAIAGAPVPRYQAGHGERDGGHHLLSSLLYYGPKFAFPMTKTRGLAEPRDVSGYQDLPCLISKIFKSLR